MAAPRSGSHVELSASLASQLPQVPGSRTTPPFVGAGLARDGSTAVRQSCRFVCIAGKPAPTGIGEPHHTTLCGSRACPRWQHRDPAVMSICLHRWQPAPTGTGEPHHSTLCGSRACPRWQHRGPAVMSNCLHRWQASSHRYWGAAPLHPLWEPGLPAMAAPRSGSHVELSASLASQLPQSPGVVYNL